MPWPNLPNLPGALEEHMQIRFAMYNFWDHSLPQPSEFRRFHGKGTPLETTWDVTPLPPAENTKGNNHNMEGHAKEHAVIRHRAVLRNELWHKVKPDITIQWWFDFLQLANDLWQSESSGKIDVPFKILCPFSMTMLNILDSIPRSSGQNMDRTLNPQLAETLDGGRSPFSSRLKYQHSPSSTPEMVQGKIYRIALKFPLKL